jgi:hypothetical protein
MSSDDKVEEMREECRQRLYKAIEHIDIERRALVDRLGELGGYDVKEIVELSAALPQLEKDK